MIQRRAFLAVAAAVATALAGTSTSVASSSAGTDRPTRVWLTLLQPTGRHDIGTISLHLVDHNRQDPYWSTPHARELMVSVWYPADLGRTNHAPDDGLGEARPDQLWPRAPWKSPGTLVYYRPQLERNLENLPSDQMTPTPGTPPSPPLPTKINISLDNVDFPITHARLDAPVARSEFPYPVVLYSPAGGNGREHGTMLAEDLASRGYIVVAISHTYNASQVEFPDGRVERGVEDPLNIPDHLNIGNAVVQGVHVADARFVIDKLAELAAGLNPDAALRPLPRGLHRALDMSRIGMFGHSVGGGATAHALALDDRIAAGINLDGSIFPLDGSAEKLDPEAHKKELARVAKLVGARPFMAMTSNKSPEQTGVLLNGFYSELTGYRRLANLVNGTHGDFEDLRSLLQQMADTGVIPTKLLRGTLDPARSVAIERTYLAAFFDLWLKNKDNHLLDGPSDDYPEIELYF